MSQPDEDRRQIIDHATRALSTARMAWRRAQPSRQQPAIFPSRTMLTQSVEYLSHALFPGRIGGFAGDATGEDRFVAERLDAAFALLDDAIRAEFAYWQDVSAIDFAPERPAEILRLFAGTLSRVRALIDTDVAAIFRGDPAARSVDEILICYPGAVAILHHRLAHELDSLGVPIVARIVSEIANERTGIDIHPGATIGPGFFIDHGTGVVIGETAVIGARVRLYQHVTLGARTPHRSQPRSGSGPFAQRVVRHPIVGDDVVIYAGATILGRVTIGDRAVIGGNVWLLQDVAANSVIMQPEAVPAGV
ncbi:serine acetyltransferase [Sphingomonas sp. Leaf24]|uniref:serine O-acetyltransferase EpsC n=1 Tax=unclassified Sphingomonas TaxID=196159 RepID=UPI0006FDCEA4|nr:MULTISPECIES: serine O-acetyltransferase EpsC [unclassified Sphingomonas]KQM22881.1 serine acetyltransferase [Sphingomonas sp. Leaf5]KQM95736.1 serine acetyltransferase [Sphingomonas sp. Leaf24]